MKVLAWVPYPLGVAPGQRYRIEQWSPYLPGPRDRRHLPAVRHSRAGPRAVPARPVARQGRAAWPAGFARRLAEALQAREYDAVLLQREGSPHRAGLVGAAPAVRQPAIVYDFDDAIYLPYVSPTNRYLSYLKFPWKTRALCRMAAAVMAGNDHLAEYASRYNDRVFVVPSTVSLREYQPRPAPAARPRPRRGLDGQPQLGAVPLRSCARPLQELRAPARLPRS